jgi:hypothetical protein
MALVYGQEIQNGRELLDDTHCQRVSEVKRELDPPRAILFQSATDRPSTGRQANRRNPFEEG